MDDSGLFIMDRNIYSKSFCFTLDLISSIYQFKTETDPPQFFQTNCQFLKNFILSTGLDCTEVKPNVWDVPDADQFGKLNQWRSEYYEQTHFLCQEI